MWQAMPAGESSRPVMWQALFGYEFNQSLEGVTLPPVKLPEASRPVMWQAMPAGENARMLSNSVNSTVC